MSIWETEPGSLSVASTVELLADRYGDRVVAMLPPDFQAGIAVAQIATAAGSAITAAAASGPLAAVAAVYAGFKAINSSLNEWAEVTKAKLSSDWGDALDSLSNGLINSANGKILSTYQPSDNLSLKRPQAFTAPIKKKGKTTIEGLLEQFRPGYAVGIKRTIGSDYIAATVPILVFTGHPLGDYIRESIYSANPAKTIGPLSSANGWENDNRWAPFGFATNYQGNPVAGINWAPLVGDLQNATGCPPVRQRILVAPGLAPYWGPYGQQMPTSARMAAYAASLMGRPPSDLDAVTKAIDKASQTYGLDPLSTGIVELLWSREDMARRGDPYAGQPRGDSWAGPFSELVGLPPVDPQQQGNGGGNGMGGFGEISGGEVKAAGGGAVILLGALGAGYYLYKRKRR